MSFFDDLESSPQENIRSEAAEAETENAAEAPETENTVKPDQTEFTSADFWDSVAAVRKKRSKKLSAVVIVFMLFIVIVTSFIITVAVKGRGWLANIIAGDQRIEFTLPIAKTPQLDDKYYEEDGRYTAQGIAEAVSPSVVSIEIYKTGTSFAAVGQGSGIVMSEDGYILTNAHVVDGASKGIKVVLSDKTEYEAKDHRNGYSQRYRGYKNTCKRTFPGTVRRFGKRQRRRGRSYYRLSCRLLRFGHKGYRFRFGSSDKSREFLYLYELYSDRRCNKPRKFGRRTA